MAHINTGNGHPGIVSLLFYKTPSGRALSTLAHTILKGPSPLSSGERETIASYVSWLNECEFCHKSHAAAMVCHLDNGPEIIEQYKQDVSKAPISEKMKALLRIAGKVQKGGKQVTDEDVQLARKAGANDEEIHDAVLVAAAFCMYNRYVDGLNTPLPEEPEKEYPEMGKRLAGMGYKYPPFFIRWLIRRQDKKKMREKAAK